MGGHTCLRLATLYPERMTHLVTMGPPNGKVRTLFGAGGGPSEGLKVLVEAYQDPTPENLRRLVEVMTFDMARFATPELIKAARTPRRPAPNICTPTYLCGHWAMIEHAEEFNRMVAGFVAQH